MVIRHPKKFDQRTFNKFLLFPLRIGDTTKWLMRAEWVEEYRCIVDRADQAAYMSWVPVRWVE